MRTSRHFSLPRCEALSLWNGSGKVVRPMSWHNSLRPKLVESLFHRTILAVYVWKRASLVQEVRENRESRPERELLFLLGGSAPPSKRSTRPVTPLPKLLLAGRGLPSIKAFW